MELDKDFVFTPLPPVAVPAAVTANPLGRLAGLAGNWAGTGFNSIWRPNHTAASDHFLELNRTTEKLDFTRTRDLKRLVF